MSAKLAILNKLQQAADERRQRGDSVPSRPDFTPMERTPMTLDELANQFEANITSVNAEVIRTTEAQLTADVQQLLIRKKIQTLLLAANSDFKESLSGQPYRVLYYDRPIEEWQPMLFNEVDASITQTQGGIAETGTLVLWPTVEEPRLMSLVPPIHIAILRKSSLLPTFWHFMQAHNWSAGMPTNALLISGPSKTADIEQTLAYGVHGPKELVVMLVE